MRPRRIITAVGPRRAIRVSRAVSPNIFNPCGVETSGYQTDQSSRAKIRQEGISSRRRLARQSSAFSRAYRADDSLAASRRPVLPRYLLNVLAGFDRRKQRPTIDSPFQSFLSISARLDDAGDG